MVARFKAPPLAGELLSAAKLRGRVTTHRTSDNKAFPFSKGSWQSEGLTDEVGNVRHKNASIVDEEE